MDTSGGCDPRYGVGAVLRGAVAQVIADAAGRGKIGPGLGGGAFVALCQNDPSHMLYLYL